MAKTLQQIEQQIAQLQQRAQALRLKAAEGAVVSIRQLMADHGLSMEELVAMLSKPPAAARATKAGRVAKGVGSATARAGKAPAQKSTKKPARLSRAAASASAQASQELAQTDAGSAQAVGSVSQPAAPAGQNSAPAAKRGKGARKPVAVKGKSKKPARAVAKAAASKPGVKASSQIGVIKYRDDAGNAWTGRGTKPKWFVAALAAGKTPQDLLVVASQR
jgi:DNA-binding protein H-NS